MEIGIIGHGIVGQAIHFGFTSLGHQIKVHDIKMDTQIEDVLETEISYICVPTNSLPSGECDVSIVLEVVDALMQLQYKGIIAIKSTVIPGTVDQLRKKYNSENICFIPEFLRERCAIADFADNHDLCVVGTYSDKVFETVKDCHGHYPRQFIKSTPTEAELCKYFNNIYNASLITFANAFYEICKLFKADYTKVKNICINRDHIVDNYLDCNENLRSFGGACLSKDLRAIAYIMAQHDSDVEFFKDILKENDKYETTVFSGMRP
ncbi:hypothetical protein LCGC14_0769080 [marine sediment metagenome]|uniref:UDP-glucose/GDP-mannose dehydrogenase dimerisation domain-containing protein n=1 Tax=marine sediment metagenome TaxID=412755 RepID=A0A0F9T5S8_9ZZZZ